MKRSDVSLRSNEGRYLLLGFAIAIVAAASVALTSSSEISENYAWIDWITHTGTVLGTLDMARADSVESLAALQNYFQNGDRKSLDKVALSVSEVRRQAVGLRILTEDNQTQQQRLDQVDQTGVHATSLVQQVIRIAATMSRVEVVKAASFLDLDATLFRLRAEFNPMYTTEQALLIDRTTKARATSRRGAMVMGVGGSFICFWLLLIGGYAGLTTSRLKQTAHALVLSQEQLARVAERKKADDRFRALLESAPDPMVILSQDGCIVLVNAQAERLFGYARAELLGNPGEMLIPARFRGLYPRRRNSAVADRGTASTDSDLNLHGVRKGGSEFPMEISSSRIETDNGIIICRVIRDITERRRAAEEMRLLNESERRHATQLEAANKELEAFSYSVSHDLRAPLRSIDGFSLALIEDYAGQLDVEAKAFLDRIRAATRHMATLIDDLLNLARVTRSEMRQEVVDLSAMARVILEELQTAAPQRRVECVVGEGVIGYGDPRLLRVVLENLLGNAWKFTMNKPQARIELGFSHRHGGSVYFVRDDGPGFDMAYVDKLFGTFQRLHTTTEFPGTGIGLASVRRIINRHGGRTWAEGATGKGATFSFTLSEDQGGRPSA